jgi:hypothetical protein
MGTITAAGGAGAAGVAQPRFVRRTTLGANEYRKNFHQLDREAVAAVTSAEADRVTPLMSKIYLRLANAPERYWERQGVLRIEAELKGEKVVKAWAVLCEIVGVSSATASKALAWMHAQGIVGYYSGKNGAGLRIFLNRAVSSIGVRPVSGGKKILAFAPASNGEAHVSANEAAFKDSYADRETLDSDLNSGAPKNGADDETVGESSEELAGKARLLLPPGHSPQATRGATPAAASPAAGGALLDGVVSRLMAEMETTMEAAARRAAAREHERTREWLESRGLPKAARVAQREAYTVLRNYGLVGECARGGGAGSEVGRRGEVIRDEPQPLTPAEVTELAEACVALLESRGQPVELTLAGMCAEAGGFLPPDDAARVRERINSLLAPGVGGRGE